MESDTKKRRICEGDEKHRKKRKEPRPHPSYRLNKRYWDDIRAGRRPLSMKSDVANAPPDIHHNSPEVYSGFSCVAAPPISISYLPLSFFSSPITALGAGTKATLPSPNIPYPLSPACMPVGDPRFLPFSFKKVNRFEHDTTVDVITVEENETLLANILPTMKPDSRSSGGSMKSVITNTDDCVDEIADKLLTETINGRQGNCQYPSSKTLLLPIPLPFMIPVLLPISEKFILEHFIA